MSRLSAHYPGNEINVKFTRLPVSWAEPQAESTPRIYLSKKHRATRSLHSAAFLPGEIRGGEFWEACSYGLLWLCALASLCCCFF
jgi:hypothetical protein